MPIKTTAAEAVSRWRAGVAASGPRYTAGIGKVNNWAENATAPAAVQARNQGLQAAILDGRIDAGISRLGTNNWKIATQAKAGNWQTGVNSPQAQANASAGFNKLFGYLGQAESAISGTPRGDYSTNKQRLLTWMDAMHDAAQAGKGGF